MKIAKNLRAAFAIAMAALMVAPTGVLAEEPTYNTSNATIDFNKTGSITLYKYVDNNGKSVDASGVALTSEKENMLGVVRNTLDDSEIFPEAGVKFKAMRVADIDQVTENTTGGLSVTGTYYTNIDEGFFDIMNKYLVDGQELVASESTRVTDGRVDNDFSEADDHYESDELNEKLLKVNRQNNVVISGNDSVTGEVALNRYLRQSSGERVYTFGATDEYGYTSLSNLPLGLYLVCETDYQHQALSKHDTYWERVDDGNDDILTGDLGDTEDAGTENSGLQAGGKDAGGSQYADIASPTSPFLLSVPMTNVSDIVGEDGVTHQAGSVWQYDIVAYPKNATINIHKDIVLNDYTGLTNSGNEDGLIGVDGNDTSNMETLCNMVQTNYLTNGTKLDGENKSGLTHQIDANIGDVVTHLISADVPALVDDIDNEQTGANHETTARKHNATFKISDRMTKGLKLIDHQSFKVTLTSGAWNDYGSGTITFTEGEDYSLEFADDNQSYVLTVLPDGLDKMDDIKSASYLYVLYDTKLTKDALIGTDTYSTQRTVTKTAASTETDAKEGNLADKLVIDSTKGDTTYTNENGVSHPEAVNQNTAKLTYATDRTMEHEYYSNTVKAFTYELDLTKLFTDGTKGYMSKTATNANKTVASFDYSAVKFIVRGTTTEGSEDYEGSAGIKDIVGNNSADDTYEDLIFIRVDDGVYRVWDKQTDGSDYSDVDDTIGQAAADKLVTKYVTPNSQTGLLKLIGVDARTYEITEVATAKGRNLMSEKIYVELLSPMVNDAWLEDGSIAHAYVWTGSKPNKNLNEYDLLSNDANAERMAEGRVPFMIQNNEVIKVLKTGGFGTYLFYGVGAAVIVAAVGYTVYSRKKEDKENSVNE